MLNKKRGDKRGFLQVSFGWLFAVIVGAIILFFAIYLSVKLIHTEETISSTETGKQISVLLNPLETGFGEEKTTPLNLAVESHINNKCNNFGEFGEQEISVSQKISGKWTDTGIGSVGYNKYLFSNESVEGKNFYLFSKPFNFPFNIADLIILTSSKESYCFDDAPDRIKEELTDLGQQNIFTEACPSESVRICFTTNPGDDCEILVRENQKSVTKVNEDSGNDVMYYETDALMYASIFSSPDIYECQVKRIMQRLESLALIYNDKEATLSRIGCVGEVNLLSLANSAASLQDSSELVNVKSDVESADRENKLAYCELW